MNFYIINYLTPSLVLFFLGIWGVLAARKNMIITLISIELILLSVNINFIIFSVYLDDILGQIFALLILTVAAAESAIGLALLVVYYRVKGNIDIDYINVLKG
jgi:NADH-quinone oxidoreductase subunit K